MEAHRIKNHYCIPGIKNDQDHGENLYIPKEDDPPTVDSIKRIVAVFYKIPIDAIESKNKSHRIVKSRQMVMFFSRKLTKKSMAFIGAKLGGRSHSTVSHAYKKAIDLYDGDKTFRSDIEKLWDTFERIYPRQARLGRDNEEKNNVVKFSTYRFRVVIDRTEMTVRIRQMYPDKFYTIKQLLDDLTSTYRVTHLYKIILI